ncbi:hypothetical protein C8Q77DRAFT_764330 [Trametes polyzona]|nr:hypothetical protein C8Q77DRAFT_764330 [Trametes polyzona]
MPREAIPDLPEHSLPFVYYHDKAPPRKRSIVVPKASSIDSHRVLPPETDGVKKKAATAQRRQDLAGEMLWTVVSPANWLEACMAGGPLPHDVKFNAFSVDLTGTEAVMYPGLCKGFNDILEKLNVATKFVMKITGENPDTTAPGSAEEGNENKLKPDLAMYPNTPEARESFTLVNTGDAGSKAGPNVKDSSPVTQAARALQARTVWAWAEFFVEVKKDPKISPFSFDPADSAATPFSYSEPHIESRGQLVEYAQQMTTRQHRLFMPMISIYRDLARFLRFDRAGAIISEPFNYLTKPDLLRTFVYRYTSMSQGERGFDPTAALASSAESTTFRNLADQYSHTRPHIHRALRKAATLGWPIHKLSFKAPRSADNNAIRSDSDRVDHEYLVGRPHYISRSMIGRGTTVFCAYDVKRKALVTIKDYWRTDSPGHLTEYQIYQKLWEKTDVSEPTFIPTLLGGGDISDDDDKGTLQRTMTDKIVAAHFATKSASADIPTPGLVHTRLVIKELCRPLGDFSEAKELAIAVYDALQAHRRAWKKFGILHRDLSVGNIMLYDGDEDGSTSSATRPIGLLSDWDLARTREQVENPLAVQMARSGTWQFMSVALLDNATKPHLPSDDLESAMHILNWCTLKYLPTRHSRKGPASLMHFIAEYYDYATPSNQGSTVKSEGVLHGTPAATLLNTGMGSLDHPLQTLLDRLSAICKIQYRNFPPEDLVDAINRGEPSHIPTDPDDDPNATEPRVVGLNGYADFMAAFAEALQMPWPPLKKDMLQAPDVSPYPSSSLLGYKRPAATLEDSSDQGGSSKKAKAQPSLYPGAESQATETSKQASEVEHDKSTDPGAASLATSGDGGSGSSGAPTAGSLRSQSVKASMKKSVPWPSAK